MHARPGNDNENHAPTENLHFLRVEFVWSKSKEKANKKIHCEEWPTDFPEKVSHKKVKKGS